MIELIKIVREKALSDILYAQARVAVCDELLKMAEERASEEAQVSISETMLENEPTTVCQVEEQEPAPVETVLFNMGV